MIRFEELGGIDVSGTGFLGPSKLTILDFRQCAAFRVRITKWNKSKWCKFCVWFYLLWEIADQLKIISLLFHLSIRKRREPTFLKYQPQMAVQRKDERKHAISITWVWAGSPGVPGRKEKENWICWYCVFLSGFSDPQGRYQPPDGVQQSTPLYICRNNEKPSMCAQTGQHC